MPQKTKLALLFPGQGAQYPGMGKDFFDQFLVAKNTFQEADDLLHMGLSKIIFFGSEKELTETKIAQIAIFVTSIAIFRVLKSELPHLVPHATAGLSLGEYSALVAAEKIDFATALPVVQKRAELMQKAAQNHPGTMAAVLGLEALKVEELLLSIQTKEQVYPANFNTPGQVVISGTLNGVAKATEILKKAGAKKIVPLQVSGAFHSGLMEDAKIALLPYLKDIKLHSSPISLVMNVPGDFVSDNEQIKANLIQQITSPVRWQMGIEALDRFGITTFYEIGPGRTLTAMNRKIGVQGQSLSLEKVAELKALPKEVV